MSLCCSLFFKFLSCSLFGSGPYEARGWAPGRANLAHIRLSPTKGLDTARASIFKHFKLFLLDSEVDLAGSKGEAEVEREAVLVQRRSGSKRARERESERATGRQTETETTRERARERARDSERGGESPESERPCGLRGWGRGRARSRLRAATPALCADNPRRGRANMAHIRQSRPDSGLVFQAKALNYFSIVPSWLGGNNCFKLFSL